MTCRSCRGTAGEVVLDLGRQPSAELFPPAGSDAADETHPLQMWLCAACGLAQLRDDPGTVEDQTIVVESSALAAQAEATLDFATACGLLRPGDRVVEHGSPHGHPYGERLRRRGVHLEGDGANGLDAVVDVYGLLHEPDQHEALRRRVASLAPDGILLLELHTLAAVIGSGQFAELRHGHFAYWSLPALDRALRHHGLGVHRARWFAHDAGTLVVVARREPEPDEEVGTLLDREQSAGVTESTALATLQHAADQRATTLREWLVAERGAGRRVLGYGAAGRAVPVLCHAGIDATLLPAIADASPAKHGRRMPGTDVPIVPPQALLADRPDRVLLFLPDLLPEVRCALPGVEEAGGRWVVANPSPRVVAAGQPPGLS